MITKDDMMGVMIDACPSFVPQWEAFLDEWRAEADPPLYLALAQFARHLVAMLERGEVDRLPAVFDAVERLHIEGGPYVKNAATVGLLEDLQNLNLHSNGTDPEQFRPYLGPLSTPNTRTLCLLEGFWFIICANLREKEKLKNPKVAAPTAVGRKVVVPVGHRNHHHAGATVVLPRPRNYRQAGATAALPHPRNHPHFRNHRQRSMCLPLNRQLFITDLLIRR